MSCHPLLMSWHAPCESLSLTNSQLQLAKAGAEAKGQLFVTAAGNDYDELSCTYGELSCTYDDMSCAPYSDLSCALV